MIKEQYVTFEVASLAKEKGFDEPCLYYAINEDKLIQCNNHCYTELQKLSNSQLNTSIAVSMPTQSLLARWLRETKNICVQVFFFEPINYVYLWEILSTRNGLIKDEYYKYEKHNFDTYEEAMEDALQKSLYFLK